MCVCVVRVCVNAYIHVGGGWVHACVHESAYSFPPLSKQAVLPLHGRLCIAIGYILLCTVLLWPCNMCCAVDFVFKLLVRLSIIALTLRNLTTEV